MLMPGSTGVTLQVETPPAGFADVMTLPLVSLATQSVGAGQSIDSIDPPGSMFCAADHVYGPAAAGPAKTRDVIRAQRAAASRALILQPYVPSGTPGDVSTRSYPGQLSTGTRGYFGKR